MNAYYSELFSFHLPEVILTGGALLVLAADLLLGKFSSEPVRRALAALLGMLAMGFAAEALSPYLRGDTSALGQLCLLGLSGLTLLLIAGTSRLRHPAEHVALTLFATVGFSLMVTANNLLLVFLAFELSSITLYILAGFDKSSPASAEAALKYFLYGSVAAAFLLFGFSLLYGLTGEIELAELGAKLSVLPASPLLVIAWIMILAGFGYKAAAAPFHLWAPDAYQGAPAPSAALIAAGSKLAGMLLLVRLFAEIGFSPLGPALQTALALLIAASLLLGNVAALVQSNFRRLLAYSAIGHAGIVLLMIGIAPADPQMAFGDVLYYLLTYGLASVGAFGVAAVLEANDARGQKLSDFAGLWQRSPFLTICLLVFILSLAGVPPLAGFFAKFNAFYDVLGSLDSAALTSSPFFWLVLLAIAMSAVALYYYLQVLKQAFIAPAEETRPLRIALPATTALLFAAAGIVLLGIFPEHFLRLLF